MAITIIEALKKLDPSNDNHWTSDGECRIDTVKFFTGDPSITRASIEAVAPGFNREKAKQGIELAEPALNSETSEDAGAGTATTEEAAKAPQNAPQTQSQALTQQETTVETKVENLKGGEELTFAEKLAQFDDIVQEALTSFEKAKIWLDQKQAERDEFINSNTKEAQGETFADSLALYQDQQRKLREAKAAQLSALSANGITRKMIEGMIPKKSPLDESLARKSARNPIKR